MKTSSHHCQLAASSCRLFLFLAGTLVFVALAQQQDTCSNIAAYDTFEQEECCYNPSNECGNYDFCLGVAIAVDPTRYEDCCDSYETCQDTLDLFHTLDVVKGLSIGDIIISSIIFILTAGKGLLACWFGCHGKTAKQSKEQLYLNTSWWLSLASIVCEVIDFALVVSVISKVKTSGSKSFVSNLRAAGCFNEFEDRTTIFQLESLLEDFLNIAIAEAVLDAFVVIVHVIEMLYNDDAKDVKKVLAGAFAGVLDVIEFCLAAYNISLLLDIIDEANALHETMKHAPSLVSSGACVYYCCITKLQTQSGTGVPSEPMKPTASAPTLLPPTQSPVSPPSTAPPNPTFAPPILLPTEAPTSAPLQPPTEDLANLLLSVSFDGGAALQTQGTPQNEAFNWLANKTSGLGSYSDERKIQRYVLATLYYSTNGDSWNDNNGWLTDSNECGWHNEAGTTLCSGGSITRLDLFQNNLVGTIPAELALLPYVDKISFGANDLMGTIPTEIRRATTLTDLRLWANRLDGTIPTEIAQLTDLEYLVLSSNDFTGTVPSEIASLKNLKYLDLYRNFMLVGAFVCPGFIENCYISCIGPGEICRSL